MSLIGIQKRFGPVTALGQVSLEVQRGGFFTLLGPSGCGKTTLLRLIGGFELPSAGQILLGGQDITYKAAQQRPINTVFQSYALFPHLNVYENIAFGLRSRRMTNVLIGQRVTEVLAMLQLEPLSQRMPHQLSGGQKQRVAMARALVNHPEVLLLDEPMSALDAKLRAEVQVGLRRLQRQLGTTFVLVTHDQDEAMTVSDRIAVMQAGQVAQVGSPQQVYAQPRNRFVAEFLGAANLIAGRSQGSAFEAAWGPLQVPHLSPSTQTLAIRPENIELSPNPNSVNRFKTHVREAVYRGSHTEAWLELGGLRVRTPLALAPGQAVEIGLPPTALVALED